MGGEHLPQIIFQVIVFRFEDPDRALEVLKTAGVRVLTSEELLGK